MSDRHDTTTDAERSLLYALSLAIGHTHDARATARDFLTVLVARCALDGAALWWRDPQAEPEGEADLVLLATQPPSLDVAVRLPSKHPFWQHIRQGEILNFRHQDSDAIGLEDTQHFEACTVLPLAGEGLLILYAPTTSRLAQSLEEHLPALVARLGAAIRNGISFERLRGSEERLREKNRLLNEYKSIAEQYATHTSNARAQLHALFRHLPDLVWLKSPEGVYLACNHRFECFFGASEKEIVGKTDYDFVDRELADFFRQQDQLAVESGGIRTNEEWITFADDGHQEYLETSKTPMYDDSGQLIGVLGIGHDFTERKRIEEALRQTEEGSRHLAAMLRLLCDNVPDMIWAKGLDKRYLFANKALCDNLLGARDVEEPLGKTDLFFARRERESHPENPHWHTFGECCQDSDALTLEFGQPSVFEEFGNVRGKPLFLEVHKSPFYNEKGEVIGTVGSARDITERKRTDAELEQHRRHLAELVEQRTSELLQTEAKASSILQSTADGLYGTDTEGRITFINPAACRMLGYTEHEVIGHCAHTLFHHRHPDGTPYPLESCPAHQAMHHGAEIRIDDEVYWHADGHPIPVMYAIHPTTRDGVNDGAVVSFVDISAHRAAAQAREHALAVAEQLARVKSEFLANMSHEIRTPLNGILGFAQIGQRQFASPEQAKNAFDKIFASSKRLLAVVNDVLDFSKIDAGKMSIVQREAILPEIIERAVELVRERAESKRLDIRVERAENLPNSCLSDPLRIEQILLNLLSNAVKFTERGTVHLYAERDGERLVFRIADTGIGIEHTALTQLFNPFQQVDGSLTRRYDGSGLGLAISKRLLELMGGTISVISTPDAGSTFTFRIPYVPFSAQPVPPQSPEETMPPPPVKAPLLGLRILVAEDDVISQMVLEHNLAEDGAQVVTVHNGRDALNRVILDGTAAYDLILMDVQMPHMDGYEATRRILEIAPGMPIIGQTAHAFSEERDKCFAAGMVGHLAKPIDPDKLTACVLHILARNGQS